jgi:O-antigen ligase
MKVLEPLLGVVLCALVAVAVFSGGAFTAGSLFALRCLTLLGLLIFALGWVTGQFAFPSKTMLAMLGVYLLLALLSTVRSPYPYGSLQAWLNLVLNAGVFVLAGVLSAQDRRMVMGVLIGCGGILGFYGLVQLMGIEAGLGQTRLSGLYQNSNHYSGLLTLVIPVVVAAAGAAQGLVRMLLGMLALVLVLNLALTFAWGLLFVLLVLLLWWRKGWMVGVALAAAVLLLFSPQLSGGNLKQRFDELVYRWVGNSLASRVYLGQASLKMIQTNPLNGIGPGNYAYVFPVHRPPLIRSEAQEVLHRRIEYAHNDYLHVASETGVPSLLAWLAFWWLVVTVRLPRPVYLPSAMVRHQTLRYWGLRAGLIALLLHGLSDGNLTYVHANALLAYLLAGLLVGASRPIPLEPIAPALSGEMVWQDQQVTEVR